MTYQHALRYLAASEPADAPFLPLEELRHAPGKGISPLLVVCCSHDTQGSASSLMLRSILRRAGIGTLHLIDAPEYDLRDRYVLNGKPITPVALCPHAQGVRTMETALRRALVSQGRALAESTFSPPHRTLAVLLRCMAEENVRVLLIEGNEGTPYLRALCDMISGLAAITLISSTDEGGRSALACIHSVTREVISHPCGPALFRACSDACVRTGSRLGTIAKTNHRRRAITLGSQALDYLDIKDCRIGSGSALAADAAVLAAEGALALRRAGLIVSNDAIRAGLSEAVLPTCIRPVSIQPLTVTACADNALELSLIMRDLDALSDMLPRPRQVVLDARLASAFEAHASFADALTHDGIAAGEQGASCTVVIGSADFVQKAAQIRPKRQKT